MTEKYRVVLVGCGGMGREHLNVLGGLPEFEVVGLCDVAPEALARAREKTQAEAYQDFERMYDELRPDIAVVATQTRGHHAPSVAALKRGISVLCEKPIAIDLEEADQMVEAARKGRAKLAINQQNHVHPAIRKAREMVQQGVIGELVMVRGRNKCGRQSGNEFTEMGTHVTDMMLCFAKMPEWCSGTVWWQGRLAGAGDIMEAKEMSPKDRDSGLVMGERATGQYGFQGGVLGEIHFLGYQRLMNSNYGVDLLGTEGQLAVRVSSTPAETLWHLPRPMEGRPPELADWQGVDLGELAGEQSIPTMYRRLVEAMQNNTEPPGSGEEGRRAFEMILGLYQSHREGGRRVSLPLKERRHPLEAWRQAGK